MASMNMEIIDRLRSGLPCKESDGRTCRAIDSNAGCDCAMAADEIERLRAVLKPFADWHEAYRWGKYPKDMCLPDNAHLKAWEDAFNAYQQNAEPK